MSTERPVVCLLTDFGLDDHYVAAMKGVLLSALPGAQIVDITHKIEPQNVRQGAFHLLASYSYQAKGTLFICVVDPGVGSDRKILYVEAGGWKFIAPDNGLLAWVLERERPTTIIEINPSTALKGPISKTFHGRDVMAPVGARILAGEAPAAFGAPVTSYVKLRLPIVLKHGSMWQGEVLAVDVYGNLITNFLSEEVAPLAKSSKMWVEFDKTETTVRGLSDSYSAVDVGKPLAIEGSSGFIEISVNQRNAADELRLAVGDRVSIHFRT